MAIAEDVIIRCGDLIVTPTVPELYIAKFYIMMVEEGIIDTVFFQSRPSLRDFLEESLTPGRRLTLGCFRDRGERGIELCGLGWAFNSLKIGNFLRCECGMAFSTRQSRKTDNVTFGKLMLQSFFQVHNVDAIYGSTPEPNKLALRYSAKLGFSLHGPIPDACSWKGVLTPVWISYLSKNQWLERNR